MSTYIAIIIAAVLTNNFVLSKFYGCCPFLGVSKKLDSSVGMGAAVVFVMLCASLCLQPFVHAVKLLISGLGVPCQTRTHVAELLVGLFGVLHQLREGVQRPCKEHLQHPEHHGDHQPQHDG